MAKKATAMKLDMQQVASFADKVSTVEGAINTGAQLQVLGGSFAQFSDPMGMMNEALTDMEGLQDRFEKMIGGLGNFDAQKGEIAISAFDKQRIKVAAEAMGMSYDQVMETTMAKGRQKFIGGQIANKGYTEDEQELLKNIATVQNGKATVSYVDSSGKKQEVNLAEKSLSKTELEMIKQQTQSESDDIKDIATTLRGWDDVMQGTKKQYENTKAAIIERRGWGVKAKNIVEHVGESNRLLGLILNAVIALGLGNAALSMLRGGGKLINGRSGGAGRRELRTTTKPTSGGGLFGGAGFRGAVKNGWTQIAKSGTKNIGNALSKTGTALSKSSYSTLSNIGSKLTGRGNSLQVLSKNATKMAKFGKIAKVGGGIASGAISGVLTGIDEFGKGGKDYGKNAKGKSRNWRKYGRTAGSAVGAVAGTIIGGLAGPLGAAVGGYIGSELGKWAGGGFANQKRRVFVSTPTTPYDVGDLWINNEELYRCKTALSSGSYNSGHWVKAVKYTDDSVAQSAKNDLQAFKKLDEWLVINNELDTYFPFDNNLQTTGGINPNSGYNAYLTPQGKFGNCLSIQEDVANLFAFNSASELNIAGGSGTFTITKISNEEVICKYAPSSSTGLAYKGKDIAVDTQRTYILSGWMYVSEDYNSTSAPALSGEQGFVKVMRYDMNKKGQWQFFSHTKKPTSEKARILLYPRTDSSVNNATTGYVLYKNVQFTQTGAVHMFYNGTKPKDTISYEVSQPDVSTMMAYKKHVLDSNFKHQALVKNGSTFTFYENGAATTNYVNKWRVYACEGITTPNTDGKNIDKYNKPLSTQLTTDLTGISHSWQATGYGYVYRTFLYCSQAKTVTLMISFDNAGCAYCNGVLVGQGGHSSNGNRCVFNLVKGWNCIELACVDADTGGGLKYVASGSDGLFSNKTSHPEILYMTAELPIEMANNKVTYFSRANCFVDEAVFLNKAITQEEAKTYVGSGKRLTDPATIIDVPEPTNVTFSFS